MKTPLTLIATLFIVVITGPIAAYAVDGDLSGLRLPRGRSNNTYQRRALGALLDPGRESVDKITLLVVRVAFTDRDFRAPYDSLYFANEFRHLNEYFEGASQHHFTIDGDIYPEVVTLARTERYYGEDGVWDERVVEILMEIVEATDVFVDYAAYDAFAVIHPWAGQETDFNGDSPEQLWSGFVDPGEMAEILADTLGTPGVPTNDTIGGDTVYVDNLMVWPEDASQDGMTFGSLGIYAYQVGLRIGMIPLFDTTPSGYPDSQGIGAFGLMGYGLYNAAGFIPAFPCAFHRYLMGWMEPVEVTEEGTIRITDINTGEWGDTTLVRVPISATEYFLIANRVHDADFDGAFDFTDVGGDDPIPENEDTLRGAEFDFFLTSSTNIDEYVEDPGGGTVRRVITGSGLMVWHIDESIIVRRLESGGRPQDDPARKGVDLEEADGIQDLDRPGGKYAFGSHYDSFREGYNVRFGIDTAPSSANNAGVGTGIVLDDISAPAPVMTFAVRFLRPFESVRSEVAGSIGALSPIPVDLDGAGGEELVIPAQPGLLYLIGEAGSGDWEGGVDTLVHLPGEMWAGSPVFADMDGDGAQEIFVTSTACSLYAFYGSGAPYPIDDDPSPGAVTVSDTLCSAPMVCEVDGDPEPEVILLAQDLDWIWLYIVGCSIDLPGVDWRRVAPDVHALRLWEGTIASHPCRGAMDGGEGFYYISLNGSGYIAHFIPFFSNGSPVSEIEAHFLPILSRPTEHSALLTIAAGDISRKGSDYVVCPVSGFGFVYTLPSYHELPLSGGRPSPPVVVDINRDGILETVVRDERALYCFTGFGILLSGWPVELPEAAIASEDSNPPPPPIVGDVDGDGDSEIIFSAGGDIHAYEVSGLPVEGWPIIGPGDASGSTALLRGAGDGFYIFSASSPDRLEGTGITGPSSGASGTLMMRYEIGVPYGHDHSWPFYRRDAGGSGRQEPSSPTAAASYLVDEGSFICYPNPASTGTVNVRLVISGEATLRIRILNIEGEIVYSARRVHRWSGGSTVPFELEIFTNELSSGVYICQVEVRGTRGSWSGTRTFAVVR